MKFPKLSFKKKPSETEQTEDSPSSAASSPQPGTSSSAGAKQWLLLHIEKIILVVSVGLFGLLVYMAFGTLKLDSKLTPATLEKRAADLARKIEASGDEPKETPPDYVELVETANRDISKGNHSFETLTGVEAQKIRKRARPQFTKLKDVRGVGGSGVFWIKALDQTNNPDAQGGTPPQGPNGQDQNKPKEKHLSKQILPGMRKPPGATGALKHWAVITAVLPVRDQHAIFNKHFRDAEDYNPQKDVPTYVLARLQRIEVSTSKTDFKPDWSQRDMEWEWGVKNKANSPNNDVPRSKPERSTTAVGRSSQILESDKWIQTAPEIVDSRYVDDLLTTPLGPLAFTDWTSWATHPKIPITGQGVNPDTPEKTPPDKKNNANRNNQNQTPPKKKSSPLDKYLDEEPEDSPEPEPTSKNPDSATHMLAVNNKLVRLFDFDVKPGKTYLYRVQVLLENPNYGKPQRILKNPTDRKWRLAPDAWLPWSDPSNPVFIPPAEAVYAGGVQNEEGIDEQGYTVIITQAGKSAGTLQIGKAVLQQGGSVKNNIKESYAIDGSGKPKEDSLKIDGDIMLVDIRPQGVGEQNETISELLFFDSEGRFFVKNTATSQTQQDLLEKAGDLSAPTTTESGQGEGETCPEGFIKNEDGECVPDLN